jgi:hypothetical protein
MNILIKLFFQRLWINIQVNPGDNQQFQIEDPQLLRITPDYII